MMDATLNHTAKGWRPSKISQHFNQQGEHLTEKQSIIILGNQEQEF